MGKLINIIPGLRLLISSLPGVALITHVGAQIKYINVLYYMWFIAVLFCLFM